MNRTELISALSHVRDAYWHEADRALSAGDLDKYREWNMKAFHVTRTTEDILSTAWDELTINSIRNGE